MRILTLFCGLLLAAAKPWTYLTPDSAFQATLPVDAAFDVKTLAGRTGFYVDNKLTKELFQGVPDIEEIGVWSVPFTDEKGFRVFVDEKVGDGKRKVKEKTIKIGAYDGLQLEYDYLTYKHEKCFIRAVGVHTDKWSHRFYCRWYKNPSSPPVVAFFESIRAR